MSTHTPGPWVVSTTDDACDMYDVDGIGIYAAKDLAAVEAGECGSALAYVSENWGEYKANAALMAAAPDMLAALKHAADNMPHPDQMIDDAIAKAEGRS